jgi:hypothetical protein
MLERLVQTTFGPSFSALAQHCTTMRNSAGKLLAPLLEGLGLRGYVQPAAAALPRFSARDGEEVVAVSNAARHGCDGVINVRSQARQSPPRCRWQAWSSHGRPVAGVGPQLASWMLELGAGVECGRRWEHTRPAHPAACPVPCCSLVVQVPQRLLMGPGEAFRATRTPSTHQDYDLERTAAHA